ncbi:MAG: hypothetical protein WCP10_09585 [Desulfuromonadales bacterium]
MHAFIIRSALCICVIMCQYSWASGNNYLDTSGSKAATEQPKPSQIVTAKPMNLSDNDSALYNVRCWQNGELIIEDTNWTAPQVTSHFISMRKMGNPSPGLYLIDFQHTFCVLKQL